MKMKDQYVKSHFFDSGAFTIWTTAAKYHKEHGGGRWDYYDTDEFWQYMEDYVTFVKRYSLAIDLYANVDVIPNPELTWRNQRWLEDKGLRPVPVVHYKTSLKWLRKYIDRGHEIIGLGGLVGNTVKLGCTKWIDSCFDVVCDNPERLPTTKLHGFGVTGFSLLSRYPWWSVDSAAWDKAASYGGIYVPRKRGGKWVFDQAPYIIKTSMESPTRKDKGEHLLTLSEMERKLIEEWAAFLELPLGKWDKDNKMVEEGLVTFHVWRRMANLHFFQMMADAMPTYPWPFKPKRRATL